MIQRQTVYSSDFPIVSRVRCGFYSKAASIFIFDAFDAASNRGRLLFKEIRYIEYQQNIPFSYPHTLFTLLNWYTE